MARALRLARCASVLAGMVLWGGAVLQAQAAELFPHLSPSSAVGARVVEAYGQRPLAFEENRGQADGRVRFLTRGGGYSLFLTATEAVLALRKGDSARTLRLRWMGAHPTPRVIGEEELPGRTNYLVGNRSTWRTGIPSFGKVRYEGIYPGTALVFYGNPHQLEYDFVVAPGADPGRIRLTVTGAERMEIDPAGDLVLHLGGDEVRLRRPLSYQEVGGVRREVASGYRLREHGEIGFELAAYDPARPLVIDPVLVYSTYLGGEASDFGNAITADAAGNAYVTGVTMSPDFPVAGALRTEIEAADAFVTKLTPSGALVFSTYLGGSREDGGSQIAVDAARNVYVAGNTNSFDFPRVNPLQPPLFGTDPFSTDLFVTKLDPSGSTLIYSTNLGGSGYEFFAGLAVDPQGHAFVSGTTSVPDFPTAAPLSPFRGGSEVFVAKLTLSGSGLDYFTYLGGTGGETSGGITLDGAGYVYVTGITYSLDFPTVNAAQSLSGLPEAFAAKLHPSGAALVYSTYLGGRHDEDGRAIAVDSSGNAYVTGNTNSDNFPTFNAVQPSLKGTSDLFVVKLGPAGALTYSTYLGGNWLDSAGGIAVDAAGNAYVTGVSETTASPPDTGDVLFAKLAPQGTAIVESFLIGSENGFDEGRDIALDPRGNVYLTGITGALDFPVVNAFQAVSGGPYDAFVIKIAGNRPPDCSAASAHPALLWPPNGKLVPVAVSGVTDPDGDRVTITVTGITQDEPLTGGPAATGVGTSTARVKAERMGQGDGRVYHIAFRAADPQGATCMGRVTVCVPHDQRPGSTCRDGGALF